MYQVQVFNNIAKAGLSLLDRAGFSQTQANPDAILLRSEKLHGLSFPDALKAVVRAGAGVNNIPVETLSKQGVVVFNTPGANANAVKELVLASLFIASRNLLRAYQSVQQLDSSNLSHEVEATKKQFKGREIQGKTLAVIGLGAIGGRVANAAVALGLKVRGFDLNLTVSNALKLSSQVKFAENLNDALKGADYISLHVPYLKSTHHLINEALLSELKTGVVLLNFARNEIVDESALYHALEKKVSYYLTDFPSSLLLNHEKVISFPHLGASTQEAEENCAVMAAEQLVRFLKTGEILNSVNFPELSLTSLAPYRITLSNLNCPNMLGQITSTLAAHNINIIELSNRSKGEIAYNLIDVDQAPSEKLLSSLRQIEGVLKVRAISLHPES